LKYETPFLQKLILLGSELSKVKDFNTLMEKILKSVRDFVHCDAGSIYFIKDKNLIFGSAQNDTLQNLLEPGKKLIYTSFIVPIDNKSIAGYVAMTGETVNTPNAYNLQEQIIFDFAKIYDKRASYKTHSILTVPLKTSDGNIFGVLQLINALGHNRSPVPFHSSIEPYITHFVNIAANTLERALLTRAILLRMIKITELRDPKESGNHVRRVAGYSAEIYETWAKKNGIPQNEILHNKDILNMAAMLHDVGKSAISDFILKKPGKLTKDEFEIVKTHTILGAQILFDPTSEFEKAAQIVALNHHERFDGKGYPGHVDMVTGEPLKGHKDKNGNALPKKGNEIPLIGRIVALADVYDALSFQRVYKKAWKQERVLSTIWDEGGKQFDPEIVEAFFDCLLMLQSIAERYP